MRTVHEQRLRPSPMIGAAERRDRPFSRRCAMTALLIGYARASTDAQDLTAQGGSTSTTD